MSGSGSAPRLDKNALISIWMETALWGINLVVYGAAVYVITNKNSPSRLLVLTSTMLMLLATAHVSLSLRQLMEAFIDIPSPAPPLYSILYWLNETNGVNLAKIILYDTTVFMQDLVLIWRLYVVFARNWLVIVIPLIVEAVHMAAAYAATAIAVNHPITSPLFAHTALAGWSLDLVVNVCVTLAIAGRLWFFSRKIQPAVRTSGGKYQASIYTIVESGGLFAATTLAIVILYVRDSALIVNAMDVATQLACLTPMLIVVRIGFGITHGDARSTGTTAVSRPLAFGRNNYSMSRLDSTGQTDSLPSQQAIIVTTTRAMTGDDESLHKPGIAM